MNNNVTFQKPKEFKKTLGRLLRYLKPQRKTLIAICLLSLLAVAFSILGPFLLGLAITEITDSVKEVRSIDFSLIMSLCVTVISSYTLSNFFSFLSGFMAAKMSQKVVYRMRSQLKEKLDMMPLNYYDTNSNGEILSRVISDIDLISTSLQQSVSQIINGVFTILSILVIMLILSPLLTLVALVAIPLSAIVAMIVAKHSQKQFAAQQKETGSLNAHIEEMFSGHSVIKLYSKENDVIDEFEDINSKLSTASQKAQTFSGLIMPLTKLINNLTYVAICVVGAWLALNGSLKIGFIQAFIQYSRQFMDPIVQLSQIANVIQATIASSERVFEVLDSSEEVKDIDQLTTLEAVKLLDRDNFLDKVKLTDSQVSALLKKENVQNLFEVSAEAIAEILTEQQAAALKTPLSIENITGKVKFDHVDFSYKKDEELIQDMNLEIKPGDNIAIVGPTGAGKTTLVNLLMRFYEIDKGSIDIDGIDIRNFKRSDLRKLYGMVLQDTWLFSGSIRDNIAYAKPDATMEEVVAAAKKAHVHHFIKTLPDGYNTVLSEDASSISQGQRQLLTIARAILADSKILILDEATSSVDTRTEQYIQSAMTAMMTDKTSFVIAHRLSTIKNADLIIVMNKGRVIEHGNHTELISKKGFYADLYNSQFA